MRQVLYVSTSTDPGNQVDVDAILLKSRHNSAIDGMTGLLWVCGDRYLQVIEGEPHGVGATMSRIAADPRHLKIENMIDREIDKREFQSWSMVFCHSGETAEQLNLRVRQMIKSSSTLVKVCFEELLA